MRTFPAKRVLFLMIVAIVVLTVLGFGAYLVAGMQFENRWLNECQESFVRIFDTDGEGNVPSWYSSSMLLVASGLLAFVAYVKNERDDEYIEPLAVSGARVSLLVL